MTLQEGLETIKDMNFGKMTVHCPNSRVGIRWSNIDFSCENPSYLHNRIVLTSQFAEYLLENCKNDTLDNLAHLPDAT